MNGIIIVNKEKGFTSRDVVNKLCHLLNTKKIGHTGTLDPIATGVLVCTIGKYTKLCELLTSEYKEYIATMRFGIDTDTLDITGNVLKKEEFQIDKNVLKDVLNSFLGNSIQEVPAYSAVKVNGKKLYEYARNNEYVELPKKEINIKSIELLNINNDEVKFKCLVSKGTYIRSLIRDIAKKLGTVAIMTELERTKQGKFDIDDSFTLSDIENNNYKLLDIEDVLNLEIYMLNEEEYKKVKNGNKIECNISSDKILMKYNNEVIAIYEKEVNNDIAKPLIMLNNA